MGSNWDRMKRLIRARKRSSTTLALALIAASALLLINVSQTTNMGASITNGRKLQEPWCFTQMVQNGNFEQDSGSLSEWYNQGSGTKTLKEEDGSHAIDIADMHQVHSFGGNSSDNHTEGWVNIYDYTLGSHRMTIETSLLLLPSGLVAMDNGVCTTYDGTVYIFRMERSLSQTFIMRTVSSMRSWCYHIPTQISSYRGGMQDPPSIISTMSRSPHMRQLVAQGCDVIWK